MKKIMKKILEIILKILKILSWIWIGAFSLVAFLGKNINGEHIFLHGSIFVLFIIIGGPAAFLIWRFNAEKEIRLQRKKEKELKLQMKEEKKLEEEKIKLEEEKINEQNKKLSEETIQKIMEFKELLSLGIITEEEFSKKKNELLN